MHTIFSSFYALYNYSIFSSLIIHFCINTTQPWVQWGIVSARALLHKCFWDVAWEMSLPVPLRFFTATIHKITHSGTDHKDASGAIKAKSFLFNFNIITTTPGSCHLTQKEGMSASQCRFILILVSVWNQHAKNAMYMITTSVWKYRAQYQSRVSTSCGHKLLLLFWVPGKSGRTAPSSCLIDLSVTNKLTPYFSSKKPTGDHTHLVRLSFVGRKKGSFFFHFCSPKDHRARSMSQDPQPDFYSDFWYCDHILCFSKLFFNGYMLWDWVFHWCMHACNVQ